jgi:H+/gluconate symporter-like permease
MHPFEYILRPIRSRVVCYDYIYMASKNRPTEYRWVITQVLDSIGLSLKVCLIRIRLTSLCPGISPEIAVLSTCAGALAVVHVNDSFFWVVTRFVGMDVSEGYRSLTILTLLQGLLALATVWGLSLVF